MRLKFTKVPLYLGMVVLLLSLLVAASSLGNKSPTLLTRSSANIDKAIVSLSPQNGSYNLNEAVDMWMTFSSDEPINGSDVIINFKPEIVDIQESQVLPGNLFSLAYVKVDQETGKLTATLISKNKTGEKSGILLRFQLRGKAPAESRIEIDKNTKLVNMDGTELSTDFKTSQITFK